MWEGQGDVCGRSQKREFTIVLLLAPTSLLASYCYSTHTMIELAHKTKLL